MLRLQLVVVKFWLKYKPLYVLQWGPSFKFLNNKSTIQGTPQKRLHSDYSLLPRGNFNTCFITDWISRRINMGTITFISNYIYIYWNTTWLFMYIQVAVSQNKLFSYFSIESNVNLCTVLGTFLNFWSSQIDNM